MWGLRHTTPALRIYAGEGAVTSLGSELERAGCRRALVITGNWLSKSSEAAGALHNTLGSRLAATFDRVQPHSPLPSVEAAAAEVRRVSADCVIAVGGGSAVVTARAATILAAEELPVGDLATHREPDGRFVSPRLTRPKIPNWVVPTTPTTALARAGAAVRDPRTGQRFALFDPRTRAQGVFVDSSFVGTAPPSLVVSAALNALSMSVESLQASGDDPLADALSAQALHELAAWLPGFSSRTGDLETRMRLVVAAMLCGQGSEHSRGGVAQALSHAAGPRSRAANGIVEALLLPHSIAFTSAGGLGALGKAAVPARDALLRASVDVDHLLDGLLDEFELPRRLRDVGIERHAIAEIADHASDDWSLTRALRRPTHADLVEILRAAW